MAGTASPRSEPAGGDSDRRLSLAGFLAAASGARACEIVSLSPLSGGAIQENLELDARFAGGLLAGEQRLVLRAAGNTGVPSSLDRLQEFAVLKAAFAAGVAVPEPLFASADKSVFGKPFFVMRRLSGTAAAHLITRDRALAPALPAIAERLGRELARIHAIRPPRPDLGFLKPSTEVNAAGQIAGFRAWLDIHPAPRPVLEWGLRWLETHQPPPIPPVLCHHDFRTGNYLLDGTELTGILDWEFAGWGDPHEDIGWFCSKGWRFARLDREAGGIAARTDFYRGYEAEGGRAIEPDRVHFWEVLASVRWAVIALQQTDRFLSGGERSLDLALTGRRAGECEIELLMLLDPEAASRASLYPARSPASPKKSGGSPPGDLPDAETLLKLAADVLVNDLLPLLPSERRLDARMAANCIAIAAREAALPTAAADALEDDLAALYGRDAVASAAAPSALLKRFARDLRNGGFENSPERAARARAILWRSAVARLRLANPRFLAANGIV